MYSGLTLGGLSAQPLKKRDTAVGVGYAKWLPVGISASSPAKPTYAIRVPWVGTGATDQAFAIQNNLGVNAFSVRYDGGTTAAGFVTATTLTSTGNTVQSNGYTGQAANTTMVFTGTQKSGSGTSNDFQFTQTISTKSGGQTNYFSLLPTYSGQTGATANTDFLINRTETAIGSGAQLLVDFQVGGVSKFSIDNAGNELLAGTLIHSVAGAASTPPVKFTGALFTGGSGTTTMPHLMFEPTGATAKTNWATTGTFIGINANGGTGNYVDFGISGATKFSITVANGDVTCGAILASRISTILQLTVNASATLTGLGSGTTFEVKSSQNSTSTNAILYNDATGTSAAAALGFGLINSTGAARKESGRITTGKVGAYTPGNENGYMAFSTSSSGTLAEVFRIYDTKGFSIGNTTDPGANNLSVTGVIIAGAPVRLKGYTVATLPAGTQGDTAFVTDALAPTFGTTVAGSGAVVIPVFYDGTNWIVG